MLRLFTLILALCLFIPTRKSGEGIDPELMHIVQEFFFMKNGKMGIDSKISISIGKLKDPNWVGVCYYNIFGPEIVMSDMYWNHSTYLQNHSSLFHELSHCILRRGHYPPEELADVTSWKALKLYLKIKTGGKVESHMKDGCPVSIMWPYSFSDECYSKHFEEYMLELFDKEL